MEAEKEKAASASARKLELAPPGEPAAARQDVRVERSAVRCPFCHDEVATEDDAWVACAGCLARHHAACWNESRKCATCGDHAHLAGGRRRRVRRTAALVALGVAILAGLGIAAWRQEQMHRELRAFVAAEEAKRAKEEAEKTQARRYLGETAAVTALREKADAGDAEAMFALAQALAWGKGVSPNQPEATRWYQRAADAGHVKAMSEVARAFRGANDDAQYFFWLTRAAETGDADATFQLASALKTRGPADRAAPWFRRLAEAGDRNAMLELADLLFRSPLRDVPDEKRLEEAKAWREKGLAAYRTPAEAGKIDDMLSLARIYENGMYGIDRDYGEAARWWKKAAEARSAEGMYRLGDFHRWGHGDAKRDPAEAWRWLRKAADGGHDQAMGVLASDLAQSQDPKLEREAVALFRRLWVRGSAGTREWLVNLLKKHPDLRIPGDPS